MLLNRVIPCLLLHGRGLVKTVKFKHPRYVGDPINTVRIFNDKEVDELVFFDISATSAGSGPNFELVSDIASEAFMPFGYGGGISNIGQVRKLFALGVEKVIVNSAVADNPGLIGAAAELAGSSSVVGAMDVRRTRLGRYTAMTHSGTNDLKRRPVDHARYLEELGAGEVILNSIDRDGTRTGYDLDLIEQVSAALTVPLVAVGGASELAHLRQAVDRGASAVGAGSMFVFYGKQQAVLITYPEYQELERLFKPAR